MRFSILSSIATLVRCKAQYGNHIIKGRGYILLNATSLLAAIISIGVYLLILFIPRIKGKYTVDNTRVGQITDYDKRTLDVWTTVSINAQEAVSLLKLKVLTEHLNFCKPFG